MTPALPVTTELRLALGFLVGSAGLVALTARPLAVLERVEDDAGGTEIAGLAVRTDD